MQDNNILFQLSFTRITKHRSHDFQTQNFKTEHLVIGPLLNNGHEMGVCQQGVRLLGMGVRTLASLPQLCFHHGSPLLNNCKKLVGIGLYVFGIATKYIDSWYCMSFGRGKYSEPNTIMLDMFVYPMAKVVGIHGHLASEYGFSIHHQGMALDVEPRLA